jgi:hypothetical protein
MVLIIYKREGFIIYKWEGFDFHLFFEISFSLKVSSFPFHLGVSKDKNVLGFLGVSFHFSF